MSPEDTHTVPQRGHAGSARQAHPLGFCLIYLGTASARPYASWKLGSFLAWESGGMQWELCQASTNMPCEPLGKSLGAAFPPSPSAGTSPPSFSAGVPRSQLVAQQTPKEWAAATHPPSQ